MKKAIAAVLLALAIVFLTPVVVQQLRSLQKSGPQSAPAAQQEPLALPVGRNPDPAEVVPLPHQRVYEPQAPLVLRHLVVHVASPPRPETGRTQLVISLLTGSCNY